eukprot:351965-Chlamydomonas_euryale.AAC.19
MLLVDNLGCRGCSRGGQGVLAANGRNGAPDEGVAGPATGLGAQVWNHCLAFMPAPPFTCSHLCLRPLSPVHICACAPFHLCTFMPAPPFTCAHLCTSLEPPIDIRMYMQLAERLLPALQAQHHVWLGSWMLMLWLRRLLEKAGVQPGRIMDRVTSHIARQPRVSGESAQVSLDWHAYTKCQHASGEYLCEGLQIWAAGCSSTSVWLLHAYRRPDCLCLPLPSCAFPCSGAGPQPGSRHQPRHGVEGTEHAPLSMPTVLLVLPKSIPPTRVCLLMFRIGLRQALNAYRHLLCLCALMKGAKEGGHELQCVRSERTQLGLNIMFPLATLRTQLRRTRNHTGYVWRLAEGLSKQALEQAIKDVRGSNKVTDQDPEGKYEVLQKYARDMTQVGRAACRTGGGMCGCVDGKYEVHRKDACEVTNVWALRAWDGAHAGRVWMHSVQVACTSLAELNIVDTPPLFCELAIARYPASF